MTGRKSGYRSVRQSWTSSSSEENRSQTPVWPNFSITRPTKRGPFDLHGMWTSLASTIASMKTISSTDTDGYVDAVVEIKMEDENSRAAASALRLANGTAVAMILFWGDVFDNTKVVDWVLSFGRAYLEDQHKAARRPVRVPSVRKVKA